MQARCAVSSAPGLGQAEPIPWSKMMTEQFSIAKPSASLWRLTFLNASMCAESFVIQKLPVLTGLANRLLPAAEFVLCTQKSKLGRIQP